MIYADPSLNMNAVSTLVASLSERAVLCLMILDAEGTVLAVNRRGLALIRREAAEVCGEPWLALWTGARRAEAEAALDSALSGTAERFLVAESEILRRGGWEVELFPCDWQEGRVSRVVVIATPLIGAEAVGAAEAAEMAGEAEDVTQELQVVSSLREMLHAVSNLASVTMSAANILRRGIDEDRAELLARSLEESGESASRAVQALRAMILPPPAGDGA